MNKIAGMKVEITEIQRKEIGEAIDSILAKGWLMEGPWQEKLQQLFCERADRELAVTFNSCSSALDIIFGYLFMQTSNQVALQANAFPSVAMAARRNLFYVHWLDIDPISMSPTLAMLQNAHQADPFDVLVMQWNAGFVSAEAPEIKRWCDEEGIFMIEDCSHASGSRTLDGSAAGSFGDAAVFSLAATKPLQTGQGGIMLTDDPLIEKWGFRAKNYGRTDWFQKGEYVQEGGNYHMTEIQAAIGVVLHGYMDEAITYRRSLAEAMLRDVPVTLMGDSRSAANMYKLPIQIGSDPAALRESAAKEDIELGSAIYDFVTPRLDLWAEDYADQAVPNAEWVSKSHICLPIHNGMSMDDAGRVAAWLKGAL